MNRKIHRGPTILKGSTMFRNIILATTLLTLTGRLVADESTTEAQIEKLGALRLRVSVKLNNLAKATDNTPNGVNAATEGLATIYTQSRNDVAKRLQTENAKTGDAHDQIAINALAAKLEQIDVIWNDYNRKNLTAFAAKITELNSFAQNLAQVYQNIAGADQAWLRTGIDPEVFTAVFVALDKRLDQLTTDAKTLVTDFKNLLDERARQIKE